VVAGGQAGHGAPLRIVNKVPEEHLMKGATLVSLSLLRVLLWEHTTQCIIGQVAEEEGGVTVAYVLLSFGFSFCFRRV
jgi:hypothetical protein